MPLSLEEALTEFLSWFPPDFFNRAGCRARDLAYIDSRRNRIRFHLFTDINEYIFTVAPPDNDRVPAGHISCYVRSRKVRAGETSPRGRDFPTGGFDKATLWELLLVILATECVKVHQPVMLLYDSRKGRGRGKPITHAVDEDDK